MKMAKTSNCERIDSGVGLMVVHNFNHLTSAKITFVGADDSLPEETVAKNSTNQADFIRPYIRLRNSYNKQE
ncbi:MAG: hypothetical protein NZ805_05280 [Armatimonadetes bacterium]|nr:hypothetical protein [Armatimonadota bacterium]MDW8028013.1 hypothetical protein [Armatimonadota bacterium]